MLNEYIAQKMIQQFRAVVDYNINIMDENGIIVASCSPERIGSFHEIAWRMMSSGQRIMEVYDDQKLIGTQNGINMVLEYHSSVIGVVGVTGNPSEVKPVAALLKTAIENAYESEMKQNALITRTTQKDKLFQQLLYFEAPLADELKKLAESLGYNTDCFRIPILLVPEDESRQDEVANFCKSSCTHTKQDMLLSTLEGYPLVFLHLHENLLDYRSAVNQYLMPILYALMIEKINCRFLVGTLQNELTMYRIAFQHCMWMIRGTGPQTEVVYFYDHVQDYLQSCVPPTELRNIFKAYSSQLSEDFWKSYTRILPVMRHNMNNMVKSSVQLHMHKNTLVYQYNRIRSTLGIDPLNHIQDSDFAYYLYCFLKRK